MKSESTSNIPPLAFPVHVPDQRGPEGEPICEGFSSLGMELRDYFAAHVSVDLGDAIETLKKRGITNPQAEHTARWTAEYKYMVATAMMEARLTAAKKEEAQ